jgi:hypothetical protein
MKDLSPQSWAACGACKSGRRGRRVLSAQIESASKPPEGLEVEILEMTASQAEFKLMLYETLAQAFTVYAAAFTASIILVYLVLLTRDAARMKSDK